MADWSFEDEQPARSGGSDAFSFEDGKPVVSQAPPETAGRVAGLTARAGIKGATDVAGIAAGAAGAQQDFLPWLASRASRAVNEYLGLPTAPSALDPMSPTEHLQAGTQGAASTADYLADKANLPTPQTSGERVYSRAVEAVPGVVLAPEGSMLAAIPGTAVSGAASQLVEEMGGGKTAQFLAGLIAPNARALTSATVRGIVRGGSKGAADMSAALDTADQAGVPLTVGQASGNRAVQATEAASKSAWGGGALKAVTGQQASALGSRVDQIAANLAGDADLSATGAGEAVSRGIATTKVAQRTAEDDAYDIVGRLIPQGNTGGTKIAVGNATKLLDELTAPVYGAENTSARLTDKTLTGIKDSLSADLATGGNSMPYQSVRQLRTQVGNAVDWGFSPANPTANAGLKRLYGALTQDLTEGAQALGPGPAAAAARANAIYATNARLDDQLTRVIDRAGGPEAVFKATMAGTKDGATTLSAVMGALPDAEKNVVRATVLSRLGRPGNATDTAVTPDRFLADWGNLSPQAKQVLFGGSDSGSELRSSLDQITQTLSRVKQSDVLKNASGTSANAVHTVGLWEALKHVVTGKLFAVGTLGATVGANMALSRALANPKTARWVATATRVPPSAGPAMLAQLNTLAKQDPDAAGLASALNGQQQQ